RNLAYDEALYRGVFEQAPIGIAIVSNKSFVYQSDFGHKNINLLFENILGRTSAELSGIIWTDITHPDDLEEDLDKFEQFKNGSINGYSMEKRFKKPDGSYVWVYMIVSGLSGFYDKSSKHLCLISDITARKETEERLKESERRQSVLLSNLPGLAYRCNNDHNWTMQFVSDGCFELTGYKPESFIKNKKLAYNDIISPEYRESLWKEWQNTLERKLPFKYEYEITTAAGERKWVIEMGQGIYGEDGEVEALEGIVLDITDRKGMENNLRYINEHDRWTGLYNRDSLELILVKDAMLYKNNKTIKRALITVNLSLVQLLTINYGFHYTQNLIKYAAVILNRYCDDKRKLFNTYENRFVFYAIDYRDKAELYEFAETIAKTLDMLFITERIGGGIGILEIDCDGQTETDILMRKLLIASEKAISIDDKEFNICFYDDNLECSVNREREIRRELTDIASEDNNKGLFLVYQPILDVKTNTVCGFEALARLKTEKLGLISPAEFIPIAEKTKLIIPIGEKIIKEALRFLNELKDKGYDSIHIAVNISAIQLLRPDFTDRLLELIEKMQADPKNIGIEITESVFASDYEKINGIIGKLKQTGIQIALDDFGTGYSSLSRVKELNVNCLKIDKSFIDKLLTAEPGKAIIDDIISMTHKLGHCAVAEGVEKEEQMQYLISCGCDKIQGYLIGRPVDEASVINLLGN
ncbi:MAG: EAL domain-containing protein, partial [Eubacteriales bacterium]|nr:EAL domain-containing protein [Eubacteriales bacterium]